MRRWVIDTILWFALLWLLILATGHESHAKAIPCQSDVILLGHRTWRSEGSIRARLRWGSNIPEVAIHAKIYHGSQLWWDEGRDVLLPIPGQIITATYWETPPIPYRKDAYRIVVTATDPAGCTTKTIMKWRAV